MSAHHALRWIVHPTNNTKQRGLACTVTSNQAYTAAIWDREIYPSKNPRPSAMIGVIAFVYINHFNHLVTSL
ncbi:hypothetical protein COAQ111491_13820 [Comamonas aquatilis]